MIRTFSILLFTCLLAVPLAAQQTIDRQDYQRAVEYLHENYSETKLFNAYVQPHWFGDSTGLWFQISEPGKTTYRKLMVSDASVSDLFDHERLATVLSDSLVEPVTADDLPLSEVVYRGPDSLAFSAADRRYVVNTLDYSLHRQPEPAPTNEMASTSPNGEWVAFTREYNLYLRSTETGEERQLSTEGRRGYEYASWYGWADIMEGEDGERPAHFGVDWSEDGEWLSTTIVDLRTASKMYLLDWSVDTLYRPKLLSYYRGSPGDTGMVYVEPVFFHLPTGREVKPDLPRSTHVNAVGVRWTGKPGEVLLQWQRRGFQEVVLYQYDLEADRLEEIYTEQSPTNIDNFNLTTDEGSGRTFFLSEKSGWRQLYGLDPATGEEQPITQGEFYIDAIEHIDADGETIYFTASGRETGRNPYYQHLYRIGFDGSGMTLLTPEDGSHRISFSPDGRWFVDNFSTLSVPTRTLLRRAADGSAVETISEAELHVPAGWQPPQTFRVLAEDGETPLYGAIWKPIGFDSTRRYPIIESSYTGPHTHRFPEDFSQVLQLQSFAELGFVVVVFDGRGSAGRSKQFHDYSYKNLGGGLADHVVAFRELGRRHAWFDTTRVGIYGHSAGGYDAGHAVLAYPDFYKVAVASSADHDHRMEKAWWPEMYMGWPVDSVYEQQSNITLAGNLKGKLLVTHGGIDENVNPSATFKLAEALIAADKPFDMLILPGQRHGYQGKANRYFTKLRWNYFLEHLRGVEPIWDFHWPE